MKRKYADSPGWDKLKSKKFISKYFNNDEFKGNICLIRDIQVNERIVVIEKTKKLF